MLNVHPSLLPRWRGAAPVERAIMAGDEATGVSIMRLTAGLDSGPVCLPEREPIAPAGHFGSLSARLQALGGELLVRALDAAPAVRRAGRAGRHLRREDRTPPTGCSIRPRPARELERVVRALHPHVGARVALADGTLLGVRRAALIPAVRPQTPAQRRWSCPGAPAARSRRPLPSCAAS